MSPSKGPVEAYLQQSAAAARLVVPRAAGGVHTARPGHRMNAVTHWSPSQSLALAAALASSARMKRTIPPLPAAGFALFAVFLLGHAVAGRSPTTVALVASSLFMFGLSWSSASHLLGAGPALRFVAIALAFGWFGEHMGATRGWFFGDYHYTGVLGWRLGTVPAVIPLLWFTLCYAGYVIANLIVWHAPVDGSPRWGDALLLSLLAAMVVTAFDLGADPYLVHELKAWVMVETDGAWFGETVQGFLGWMLVSFCIVLAFRCASRGRLLPRAARVSSWHVLLPLVLYGAGLLFQACLGEPAETRTLAVFAMGIPLLAALTGWRQWRRYTAGAPLRVRA